MKLAVIFVNILIASAQRQSADLRISRIKGSILTNLTSTQEFEDHIVTSSLDNSPLIRMVYRGVREFYSRLVPGTGERHNSERFQQKLHPSTKFPCRIEGFKSSKIPKSVHQLRPGDIDIIAAVGDSLTSATAANSVGLWEVLVENRGLSWCIGGQGNWRSHLTLPNILKEFNPKLFGYSLSDSYNVHQAAQFNVAENIATTSDMPENARKLMNRMKLDPR
jgi:hypothetical protein